MKTYEITSEVRGTEQFLVVRQEQEEYLNYYLVKMLEYNSITGILPMKSRSMNGHTVLNFQLGNRFRLIDLIRQDRIGSAEAKLIYKRLVDAIAGMGEYFLNADQCVYDLEYLYVDSTLNPYMMYLPFENVRNQEINRVWREFFLDLLSYFSNGKQDPFYDKLMRYLIQPNFDLKEFSRFLTDDIGGGTPPFKSVQEQMSYPHPVEKVAAPPVQNSAPAVPGPQPPAPKVSTKAADGIAIPGSAKQAINIPGVSQKSAGSAEGQDKPAAPAGGKSGKSDRSGRSGIVIPGFSGSQKQTETSETVSEKPVKEKKQSSLFSFGKKKADTKADASQTETAQVQQAASGASRTSSGADGNPWSKTMMITPPVEGPRTVMLNTAQPHLLHNGAYIPITKFPFTVGKGSASYIVSNQTVSRIHATIDQQENSYYVRDEDSLNGTFLNGRKLDANKAVELHDGDRLRMSNEEFTFHIS